MPVKLGTDKITGASLTLCIHATPVRQRIHFSRHAVKNQRYACGTSHSMHRLSRRCTFLLCLGTGAIIPYSGILGQAGKAGWAIGRRSIAVAMGKTDQGKGSANRFPLERVAQEWSNPGQASEAG